jgi:hypothetical protein
MSARKGEYVATIGVMGPFHKSVALEPGQSSWVDFGESDGFGDCALSVTATAHQGNKGTTHVLRVDNVNVTSEDVGKGDIPMKAYNAGCNVTNNGETTITEWSVLVGVIVP